MSTQKRKGRKKKIQPNSLTEEKGAALKGVEEAASKDEEPSQTLPSLDLSAATSPQESDTTSPSPVPSVVSNKENAVPDTQATVEPKVEPAESEDPTCRSCWSTFPTINELGIHIKKTHIINRVCHPCGITSFPDWSGFEKHHKTHVRDISISLEVLTGPLPPVPVIHRSVAKKRTTTRKTPTPPQREPIKLTLRLTSGRQAKAAEEARAAEEAARKAAMLNVSEAVNDSASPSPTSKEEDLYQKAITELNNLAQEIPPPQSKSPSVASPAPSFVLRFSPSPPPSNAPDSQHSGSQSSSRPSSKPSSETPLISVRTAESLKGPKSTTTDDNSNSVLRNMLDQITSPQPNIQEPEFVSLERLADSVNMIGTPTPSPVLTSHTPPISAPQISVQQPHLLTTNNMQPLQNLAAMQPNSLLPNLLMNAPQHAMRPMPPDPLNTNPMQANQQQQFHQNMQNMMQANFQQQNQMAPPMVGQHLQNMNNMQGLPCDVCGQRWPNMTALEAHRAVAGHYRCSVCLQKFQTTQNLTTHIQTMHPRQPAGPIPPQYMQQNARNPPPLYRGPSVPMGQQYPAAPPPLVYQQNNPQFRGQYRPIAPATRPDAAMQQQQYRPAQPGPRPGYLPRPSAPQQQPATLRHALQTNTIAQQQTPTKRPAPPAVTTPTKVSKRNDVGIPARQPEDCQIIAVQRGGDGVPQIQSVQGSATASADKPPTSTIKLTDEITLSVKNSKDSANKTPQKSGANVASLLANRGITVTTATKNKPASETSSPTTNNRPAVAPVIPESLSMNSSISILPASRSNSNNAQQNSSPQQSSSANFAVPRRPAVAPAPASKTNATERPPRPPTVDLTSETANAASRAAASNARRSPGTPYQCTICGRGMVSSGELQQHMQMCHPQQAAQHSPQQQQAAQKLPYRCSLCNAGYPTVQGLQTHRQLIHKEPPPGPPPPPTSSDMGIPVVDLRAPGTVERLSRLGIHHYIPLPTQNNSGFFSIPIVSADAARNPSLYGMQSMNVTSIMPFGPLRALPR